MRNALACLLLAFCVAGCASTPSVVKTAEKATAVAYEATNAARVAFTDWELAQKPEESGATYAETLRAIETHERRVKLVMGAFAEAYTAIAEAVDLVVLVRAKRRQADELVDAVGDAVDSAKRLKVLVREAVGR